ncbi:MAG: hypothetical protein CL751_05360 [Chloroflexi bacterium]|nr:hypothetical protein [Chloroflexota bacterium]MBI15863.1 hypothetical protein [Chloroflexota bacterium]|tara:strand:- start:10347 stop:11006 length:660 start_codon:yes stop_codon:yes gene_type:complete
MRIKLIRHAQSLANADGKWQGQLDYDLSSLGEKQSFLLSKRFKTEKFKPTHIYSSPLKRALKTAEITFSKQKIVQMDDLKENGIGVFEGKNLTDIKKLYPRAAKEFEINQNFSSAPNAESRSNIRKRAERVVDFLIKKHQQEDQVAVFTHSGFLVFLVNVFLKSEQIWRLNIPNTGIFDFQIDQETWDIERSKGIKKEGPTRCRVVNFANASHLGEEYH